MQPSPQSSSVQSWWLKVVLVWPLFTKAPYLPSSILTFSIGANSSRQKQFSLHFLPPYVLQKFDPLLGRHSVVVLHKFNPQLGRHSASALTCARVGSGSGVKSVITPYIVPPTFKRSPKRSVETDREAPFSPSSILTAPQVQSPPHPH